MDATTKRKRPQDAKDATQGRQKQRRVGVDGTAAPGAAVVQSGTSMLAEAAATVAAGAAGVRLSAAHVSVTTPSVAVVGVQSAAGGRTEPVAPQGLVKHSWKEKGPGFKTGHWNKAEDARLMDAINNYCAAHNMTDADKIKLAEDHKHAQELRGAWLEIAGAFSDRTVRSIYNRGVRLLHSGNYKGSWTKEEEQQLLKLVDQVGPKWAEIGKQIHRMACVARMKWERIKDRAVTRKGTWTTAEEQKLLQLVVQHNQANKYLRKDISWRAVAAGMKTRTASQCMTKWYATRIQMAAVGGMWSDKEDARLVASVNEQNPASLSAIDWRALNVKQAAPQCRKRMTSLIKSVRSHVAPTFAEKLAYLVRNRPVQPDSDSDEGDVEARNQNVAMRAQTRAEKLAELDRERPVVNDLVRRRPAAADAIVMASQAAIASASKSVEVDGRAVIPVMRGAVVTAQVPVAVTAPKGSSNPDELRLV